MTLVERLDGWLYPGYSRNWDDALLRERILAHLTPTAVILDLGAGAGIVAAMDFRGRAGRVCGVDPDPRVTVNPHLDEGLIGHGESLPYPDCTFDLVFADNLLEHLTRPQTVFREVARVLKPGGRLLIKTPNRRHYMPLIARATPLAFHRWLNRRRGRDTRDTFPTHYRANTPGAIRRLAGGAGLAVARIEAIEGRPEYLRFSAPTYLLGWALERLVNAAPALARFRILLIAEVIKPAAPGHPGQVAPCI